MKKLDNGLYEICAEHHVVWPTDDVTCAMCAELAPVRKVWESTEGMTLGDMNAELDKLMGKAVENMRELPRFETEPRYFDRDGKPIDLVQWGTLFEDEEYKRVGADEIGPYFVSTVWLGIDHGFGRTERPLIFETMVFGPGGSGDDLEQVRVATLKEALATHAQYFEKYRALAAAAKGSPTEQSDD